MFEYMTAQETEEKLKRKFVNKIESVRSGSAEIESVSIFER
ncbi:hypothetical protein [Petralouisia muris]|jgi:hypothetical protein|nr:hypothetical protein [Petralouisia muris]